MSVSRPSPITGLCGRSAVQSYKEKKQRHKFFIAYLSDFRQVQLNLPLTKNGLCDDYLVPQHCRT